MTHLDDEYAQAGIEDPRVLITTSRDPSSKLQQFAKVRPVGALIQIAREPTGSPGPPTPQQELRLCVPNSTRINRGNYVMTELADACRTNQMTDLIVVHEHRGVPDALMLSHFPHGPTVLFTLTGVVLRHSLGGLEGTTISEAYPQCVSDVSRLSFAGLGR